MNSKNSSIGLKQTFSFTAPDALCVQLAGDFTQWQEKAIAMKPESGGVWKATVDLPPGSHHYRFIVDGQWRDDPNCTIRVPNPFGGYNAVRRVGRTSSLQTH
ncbi:MAG: glycogen-binding domain-containing protein [Limisphaerales bacterium]